jgi:hypothetical protein
VPRNSDESHVNLTPAAEQAIQWLTTLGQRSSGDASTNTKGDYKKLMKFMDLMNDHGSRVPEPVTFAADRWFPSWLRPKPVRIAQ